MFRLTIIWITALLLINSCSQSNSVHRDIVEDWVGKEIVLPEDLVFNIQDTPIEYDFNNADFKIITYIDTTGCTNCKMRLRDWDSFLNYCKRDIDMNLNFVMIIGSPDYNNIKSIIHQNDFQHPVVIDAKREYINLNKLSIEDKYNTFLLDHNNRVLAIGNPTLNPRIRDLYLKIIAKESTISFDDYISYHKMLLCDRLVRSIGIVHPGDTVRRYFRIVRDSDSMSEIKEITTSCYCTSVKYDISKNTNGYYDNINLEYVVDSISGFFTKWADVYYDHNIEPKRIIIHGYNNL